MSQVIYQLLSCSNDGTVTRWDVAEGGGAYGFEVLERQDFLYWAKAMTFSQDATMLATGNDHHSIKVWHAEEGSNAPYLRSFSCQGGQVWAVAFSSDGRQLA